MNKKWVTYLFFAGVLQLGSCGSADYSAEKSERYNEVEELFKDIMEDVEGTGDSHREVEEFEAADGSFRYLDYDQRQALEERAEQKVIELFDYLNIISNKDYDSEMRESAMEMAMDLFRSDSTVNFVSPSIVGTEGSLTMTNVVKGVYAGEYQSSNIEILDIRIGVGTYGNSQIVCELALDGVNSIHLVFNIYITNEVKKFGNVSEDVWAVYLGDVSERLYP